MEPIIRTETMKYTFSSDELVVLARTQARHHNQLSTFEDELDQIKADYKAKMTAEESAIKGCSLRITSGYEMRPVKQLVLKFRPDKKSKLIVRLDTGRARAEKMETAETQLTLSTAPDPFIFEADFVEDIDGPLSVILCENIPLTESEAAQIREILGESIRPLRKQLGDGGETIEL